MILTPEQKAVLALKEKIQQVIRLLADEDYTAVFHLLYLERPNDAAYIMTRVSLGYCKLSERYADWCEQSSSLVK